ncbi:MAG: carbohydrate ABC transporter permease [bacterium]
MQNGVSGAKDPRNSSGIIGREQLRYRLRKHSLGIAKHLALSFIGAFFLLPLFWMVTTSLKLDRQILAFPPVWIPRPFVWSNYVKILGLFPFFHYAKNTLTICILAVIGVLVSNTLIAYGFARLRWWGRDVLFVLVLSTMMLPYQVTMIPLYVFFRKLNWINTYLPLIVPAYFGHPFFTFLLRQFFLGIPAELSDSAYLDGASEMGVLVRIILPLAKPALAVVTLFQFIWSWNDFLGPLIYLSDKVKFTLSLGLANLQVAYGLTQFSTMMAAATYTVAPIIILFFFTQRTFIQGITFTGMKA